jgi:hypothetical protein
LKPAELIVSEKDVEAVVAPDTPLIVTVTRPGVAVLLADKVRVLFPVVGFGENDTVTPLGKPDALSVTLPEKPF